MLACVSAAAAETLPAAPGVAGAGAGAALEQLACALALLSAAAVACARISCVACARVSRLDCRRALRNAASSYATLLSSACATASVFVFLYQ